VSMYWALDGTSVRESTFEEWSKRLSTRIARDEQDGVVVSTIFVGLNVIPANPPFVFETMVFGGRFNGTRQIYQTWESAVIGHIGLRDKVFSLQGG